MKELKVFTYRDFGKSGGGSIRITGVLNALASQGVPVTVYSAFTNIPNLHSSIKTIAFNPSKLAVNKRVFQLLISFLPNAINAIFFNALLKNISQFFQEKGIQNQQVLFPEYLDNSLGYFLKKNGLIAGYLNDIHGIVPLEFTPKPTDGLLKRIVLFFKRKSAEALDKKVFKHADGFFFPSQGMKAYFQNVHPTIANKQLFVVAEAANEFLFNSEPDENLVNKLTNELNLNPQETVLFFAGDFKPLGGVLDLVQAFVKAKQQLNQPLRLLLIGDGAEWNQAKQIANEASLEQTIHFLGRIPYHQLTSYQQLADIIVCPDRAGLYSDKLPHVKYFDSLASGKIVINGAFAATRKMNENQKLSLDFEPSNVESLSEVIQYAVLNKDELSAKYANNKEVVKTNYTYANSVKEFVQNWKAHEG